MTIAAQNGQHMWCGTMTKSLVEKSKLLAYILRHKPEEFNVTLDKEGFAQVQEILGNTTITLDEMKTIVENDSKGRYQFSADGKAIRAVQGHSTNKVDLGLTEQKPPEYLYHGTATRFLEKILETGLQPMSRQYVHLSMDYDTAIKVAQRHGKPVVLKINTVNLVNHGIRFYKSENDVWLTEQISPELLNSNIEIMR